jgi:hypothetical protein
MMQVMRDIGGIELPQSLVKLGGDDPHVAAAPATNGNAPLAAAGKDKGKA